MIHRLSPETVLGRFRYDPATGLIYWRIDRGSARAGDVAGSMHHKGYRHIKIDGRKYMGSHVAWVLVHGEWPENHVDHRNRAPGQDLADNLRQATHAENCRNRKVRADSTIGLKGVKCGRTGFEASIQVNGKRYHLGTFREAEHAAACYRIAAPALHGEFASV
jgi:hypothetical protein